MDAIGDDGLHCCDDGAEKSEEKPQGSAIVISICGETNSCNDGDERDVRGFTIFSAVFQDVDQDGEDWSCGSDDLVEWYSDEVTGGSQR